MVVAAGAVVVMLLLLLLILLLLLFHAVSVSQEELELLNCLRVSHGVLVKASTRAEGSTRIGGFTS